MDNLKRGKTNGYFFVCLPQAGALGRPNTPRSPAKLGFAGTVPSELQKLQKTICLFFWEKMEKIIKNKEENVAEILRQYFGIISAMIRQ